MLPDPMTNVELAMRQLCAIPIKGQAFCIMNLSVVLGAAYRRRYPAKQKHAVQIQADFMMRLINGTDRQIVCDLHKRFCIDKETLLLDRNDLFVALSDETGLSTFVEGLPTGKFGDIF